MRLFDNEQQWLLLYNAALSQVGKATFQHMAMVQDRAFDCATFIGYCYHTAGILEKVNYAYYEKDWYKNDDNFLINNIRNHFGLYIKPSIKLIELDKKSVLFRGDLLIASTWKPGIANHCAIYIGDDKIIHCRPNTGVEIRPCGSSWFENRLEKVFRLEVI